LCAHFVYVRGGIVYCRLSGVCVHGGQEKNEISSMIQACVFYLQGLVYAFGKKREKIMMESLGDSIGRKD